MIMHMLLQFGLFGIACSLYPESLQNTFKAHGSEWKGKRNISRGRPYVPYPALKSWSFNEVWC